LVSNLPHGVVTEVTVDQVLDALVATPTPRDELTTLAQEVVD
jgi:hypothetical protein